MLWLLLNTRRADLEEAARTVHRDRSDAGVAMFGVVCAVLEEQAELVATDVMDALRVAQELMR
jgi:hypothetical protein